MKYFSQSFQTYPEGMTDVFSISYEELKYLEIAGFSNLDSVKISLIAASSDFLQSQWANEIYLMQVRRSYHFLELLY